MLENIHSIPTLALSSNIITVYYYLYFSSNIGNCHLKWEINLTVSTFISNINPTDVLMTETTMVNKLTSLLN